MKSPQLELFDSEKPIPPATAIQMIDSIPANREKLYVFETARILLCSRGQVYKHIHSGAIIAFDNRDETATRSDYRIWVYSLKDFIRRRTEGAR